MNSHGSSALSQNNESARTLFAALSAHLRAAQNADGGWAFHAASADVPADSRVEPTCWALLALCGSAEAAQHIARGLAFLRSQQLSDGSWPAAPGMSIGGWVTSLATLTLAHVSNEKENTRSLVAGLQWLCDDYPRDSSRWGKLLKKLGGKRESHNDEFRGWGWTPRTSSWVEPTSFALLAFASGSSGQKSQVQTANSVTPSGAQIPRLGHPHPNREFEIPAQLAKQISERRELAFGLLLDRMCAGGGWNCGNPRVYGVDGDSLVIPTCWALLALRDAPDHANRALSLTWLQKSFAGIASPGSLAAAQITLEGYGVAIPTAKRQLIYFSADELAEQGTHVAAWAALAVNRERRWP